MTEKSLRENLMKLAANSGKYAERSGRIVATKQKVLGVRVPDLRAFAKSLAREIGEFADVKNFLQTINNKIFEEVLCAGLLIFYARNLTADEKIWLTREYLEKVDSWAQIDSFVQSLDKEKFAKDALETAEQIREKYWQFALENLRSDQEFSVRYGVMVLFENFLNREKIREVFAQLREIKCDKYYVKMAIAWLYAESAINFFDLTIGEMQNAKIDFWTRKKALTKMLESRRFTDVQKAKIRRLRTKLQERK